MSCELNEHPLGWEISLTVILPNSEVSQTSITGLVMGKALLYEMLTA